MKAGTQDFSDLPEPAAVGEDYEPQKEPRKLSAIAFESNGSPLVIEAYKRGFQDGWKHNELTADICRREGAVLGESLVAWGETIRQRYATEPCEWCGKPTASWRAMCDTCEWGT